MKPTVEALDQGQLELMWSFLQMGHQKVNVPALKDLCDQLRQAMIHKTGVWAAIDCAETVVEEEE